MTVEITLIVVALISGLYMAWSIGANDVANAIGTSVGSGALSLRRAVLTAALLEFCGAFFFGSYVSDTVQTGIIDPDLFQNAPLELVYGMISSLIAAGVWLQIASYYGWPVSTTHSIVGAIVGFGLVTFGVDAIKWGNVAFIFSSWVLSPILGGIIAYAIFNVFRRKIFYTQYPLREAKRILPWVVCITFTVFCWLLLFNGLREVDSPFLTPIVRVGLGPVVGMISAAIAYVVISRIQKKVSHSSRPQIYPPEALPELRKLRKHLDRLLASNHEELVYTSTHLIQEVDVLIHRVERSVPDTVGDVEYPMIERIFSYLQVLSACFIAFAHGANDVANAIGPLAVALSTLNHGSFQFVETTPPWLLGLGGAGIIFGLATWGWRVIETIGKKITELTPSRGFAAELSAGLTIVCASRLGLPVSTTHTIVGALVGVAYARGLNSLNLSTVRDILLSWIVTIPAGATFAVGVYFIFKLLFG